MRRSPSRKGPSASAPAPTHGRAVAEGGREGFWREEAVTSRYADEYGRVTDRMVRAARIAAAKGGGPSFRPRRVRLLRACLAALGGG